MAGEVRIDGLADLRRDLRKMEPDARKEVTRALKAGAVVVAAAARPLAARKTGRLAAGFRPGASGNTAFVRNRVPYAAIHEFGGTISPRGTPITIRPQPAVSRALDLSADRIVDGVGDAIEVVATRHGWH